VGAVQCGYSIDRYPSVLVNIVQRNGPAIAARLRDLEFSNIFVSDRGGPAKQVKELLI
jgi:hypothetical protein